MESMLYPLKFKPIFKEKIWGGQKINQVLGLDTGTLPNCGECWLLSDIEGDVSEVTNGFLSENGLDEMVEIYMGDLVGDKVFEKSQLGFPLLIKFIDAAANLSVQVHPDDKWAKENYDSNGKTEMWHVIDAEPGAGLYVGFKKGVTRDQYLKSVADGTVDQLLQFYPVQKGDTFFIPAGTVHAIGAGVLLAEIQESSDITFRIFDWNRVDEHGKPRELHTEEALQVLDFKQSNPFKVDYQPKFNASVPVVRSEFFNLNMINLDKPLQKVYMKIDSFVLYICLEGQAHFIRDGIHEEIGKGEVLLLPASLPDINIIPMGKTQLMEVYMD